VLDYVLRKTFTGKEEELGFTLQRKRSRRTPAITVTDLDFADDLALLSEEIDQAQKVLHRLETEAENVGLHCNAKKTEVQAFNQIEPVRITAKN
jgi:ribosomal protein S18